MDQQATIACVRRFRFCVRARSPLGLVRPTEALASCSVNEHGNAIGTLLRRACGEEGGHHYIPDIPLISDYMTERLCLRVPVLIKGMPTTAALFIQLSCSPQSESYSCSMLFRFRLR